MFSLFGLCAVPTAAQTRWMLDEAWKRQQALEQAEESEQGETTEETARSETPEAFEDPGFFSRSREWLMDRHNTLSLGVSDLSVAIDEFISNEEDIYNRSNRSYVRLRLSQSFASEGDLFTKAKLSGKIDLPNTEDKWKLVFESDVDPDQSLDEQNRGLDANDVELLDNSDNATGALRFSFDNINNWDIDWDNGLKTPLPLDYFTRINFRRDFELMDDWYLQARQSFNYFHRERLGTLSQLVFAKQVCDVCFFRNKTEVQFRDKRDRFEFAQVATMGYLLNNDSAISFQLGVIGESDPNPRIMNYYFRTDYRYRLHEDWLFLNIVPDISFPRERDFHLRPAITFRLEVLFKSKN